MQVYCRGPLGQLLTAVREMGLSIQKSGLFLSCLIRAGVKPCQLPSPCCHPSRLRSRCRAARGGSQRLNVSQTRLCREDKAHGSRVRLKAACQSLRRSLSAAGTNQIMAMAGPPGVRRLGWVTRLCYCNAGPHPNSA